MNIYVAALIGLVVLLVAGFLFYGVFFKGSLKGNEVALTPTRTVIAAVAMYVISLAFIALYNDISFASGVTGVTKGLYLGLLIGVPFFGLPVFADASYLGKDNAKAMWAVLINWIVALAVLGIVIGAILG